MVVPFEAINRFLRTGLAKPVDGHGPGDIEWSLEHPPADRLLLALLPSWGIWYSEGSSGLEGGNQGLNASSADQVHDLGQVTSLLLSLFPHWSHGNMENV